MGGDKGGNPLSFSLSLSLCFSLPLLPVLLLAFFSPLPRPLARFTMVLGISIHAMQIYN